MRCGLPVVVVAAVQREKGSRTRNGIFLCLSVSNDSFLCIPSKVIKGAFKTWGRWFYSRVQVEVTTVPLWCWCLVNVLPRLYRQGQDRFDGTRPVPVVASQLQSQSRPVDLTEEGPAGQDMTSVLSRPSHARRLASNSQPGGQRMAAVSVGDKHVQSSVSRATVDHLSSDKSAVLPPSPARWTTNPTM
ncbi:hypothetical protein QR685DRAFT_568870 [Neurospora intermedia]|uniref:Uncharacterized protein n=1 Tax=Neurospora intermedia TaxID=5142 RepID=A0ABR3DU77_NEUIN